MDIFNAIQRGRTRAHYRPIYDTLVGGGKSRMDRMRAAANIRPGTGASTNIQAYENIKSAKSLRAALVIRQKLINLHRKDKSIKPDYVDQLRLR